jgi:hypothetical protein
MKIALALCIAALLCACAAPQPRSDFDPKADFSQLHSFAWLAQDPLFQPRDSDRAVSLLNRRRIVESIEATLIAQEFVKAQMPESADFTIAYTAGTRERINVHSYADPVPRPWGWGWPGWDREVDVRSYTAGRLAIDVLSGPRHQPIWHGVSQEELTQSDLDVAGERLQRAVAAILARFPLTEHHPSC